MGLGAVPGRQAAFREGLEQAVLYAKALGCPRYPALSPSQDCRVRVREEVASSETPGLRGLGLLALLQPSSWSFVNCVCVFFSVCHAFMHIRAPIPCWELSLTGR